MNKSVFHFATLKTFLAAGLVLSGCGQGSIKIESVDDEVKTSTAAEHLFLNIKSHLSSAEKNKIAELTGLNFNPDTKKFDSEGEVVEVQIVPVDINHDQNEDIFVITYSSFLYGNTGQGFSLFMKDESGQYKNIISLPGYPELLVEASSSMPAIRVGGPGFDFPVYTWKNHTYTIDKKNSKTVKAMSLEEAGKQYASTIE